MTKTEEALLPIIAEMKAIVDREKDASGHVSRKSVAKYFQAFVTKLEHLPRTPEGQEMFQVVDSKGTGFSVWPEDYQAQEQADGISKVLPMFAPFKVVPVIVTKKED